MNPALARGVPLLRILLPVAVLAGGIAWLFARAAKTFFALDDFFWLYYARFHMAGAGGWIETFTKNVGPFYRPLAQNVFFWAGLHLFGFNPLGFHLVCLLALIGAAGLAYAAYLRMFEGAVPPALAAGAAFAFSSVHYETVAWVSTFDEAGAALAFAAAIFSYAFGRVWWTLGFYVLALLCDETATPLPLIAAVLSLLVFRTSVKDALRRTLPLWIALAVYAAFRLFVTGLHGTGDTSFGINLSPSLWVSLTVASVANALGWLPPSLNVLFGSDGSSEIAKVAGVAFALSLLAGAGLAVAGARRNEFARAAAAGLLWFAIALSPLLLFSAHNWTTYNLAIPLMGLALAVGSVWALPASRIAWIGAGAMAVALFAFNAAAIGGRGGWDEIDGQVRQAQAAAPLYDVLRWAIERRAEGGPSTIDVVADAADLPVVKHVLGTNFGLLAMAGDSPGVTLTYTDRPLPGSDAAVLGWNDDAYQLRVLDAPERWEAALCARAATLCAPFAGMRAAEDGAYTGVAQTASVKSFRLRENVAFAVAGRIAQGSQQAGTFVILGTKTDGYGMFFYYDPNSGRLWLAGQKFVAGVRTNAGGFGQVGEPDTSYHDFRLVVTPGARSNEIEASVDGAHLAAFTDSSLNLLRAPVVVTLSSTDPFTRYKDLVIGPASPNSPR